MNTFFARSSNNLLMSWRKHAFAWLAGDRPFLQFEPKLLSHNETPSNPLTVAYTSDGFRWSCPSCEGVSAEGIRGKDIIVDRNLLPAGTTDWESWLGCDSIDLTTRHGPGVFGEAVRLTVPGDLNGSLIKFTQRDGGSEVVIRTDSEALEKAQVTVWHRVQGDYWSVKGEPGPIGRGGLRLSIPKFMGAFAVWRDVRYRPASPRRLSTPVRRLEAIQFFGFGSLSQTHNDDEQELRTVYRDLYGTEGQEAGDSDPWPTRVQGHLIDTVVPLASKFGIEINPEQIDAGLRLGVRCALFGPFLSPNECMIDQDLPIEEFAMRQWPRLAPLLGGGSDEQTLGAAFNFRDSELLDEALRWAGSQMDALRRCLRLINYRVRHRDLDSLLPLVGPSRDTHVTVATALGRVPANPSAEDEVMDGWRRMQQAVQHEFGVELDKLTPDLTAEILSLRNLNEMERLIGRTVNPTIAGSVNDLIDSLGAMADNHTAVDQCQAYGLITDTLQRGHADKAAALGKQLRRAAESIPGHFQKSFPEVCRRFREVCGRPETASGMAATIMAEDIRSDVQQALLACAQRAGARADDRRLTVTVPLSDFVAEAIRDAADLAAVVKDKESRQQKIAAVKARLPVALDPESEEAAQFAFNELLKVRKRASDLVTAFQTDLARSEAEVLKSAVLAMDEFSPMTGLDRLSEIMRRRDAVAEWTTRIDALEAKMVGHLTVQGRISASDLKPWFDQGEYACAQKLSRIARVVFDLFDNTTPPLCSLTWLYPKSSLAKTAAAVSCLAQARTEDEINRIDQELRQCRETLRQSGGLPKQLEVLQEERAQRFGNLIRECFPEISLLNTPVALNQLLRAAGASTLGLGGPRIVAESYCPPGSTRQELRDCLERFNLWPESDNAQATYG